MGPREMQGATCSVCETANAVNFACAPCSKNSVADKTRLLKGIRLRREGLLRRLERALQTKEVLDQQRQLREEKQERLNKLRWQVQEAERRLNAAKASIILRTSNKRAKEDWIEKGLQQLVAKRKELFFDYYPDLHRVQSLQYMVLAEQLANEQRQKMRRLRATIPLRLVYDDNKRGKGSAGSLAPPPYISICGIKLRLDEDFSGVPPKQVGAALGYLVQFVTLAAKYLATPLLHNPGFAASSSTVWQATSFWAQQPADPSLEFPMYILEAVAGLPSSAGSGEKKDGNPFFATQNPLTSGKANSLRSMLSSQKTVKRKGSVPNQADSIAASTSSPGQMPRGMKGGLALLKRSIASLAAGELGPSNSSGPAGWNSVAVFVAMCAALCRDTHLYRGPCVTSATAAAHDCIVTADPNNPNPLPLTSSSFTQAPGGSHPTVAWVSRGGGFTSIWGGGEGPGGSV
eukprot:CAMPEP_0197844434 /NCGR_PEP_ID=MMETSP1438-20131217/1417_1 /TAXON_ID=1461541 /ORGANISM="Pterosperma sp., Strain CCMP1384" /LENGTH=459 /DNA_ID=CAMNT_0043455207 /DNA_START=562 /DNA_END=1938 /DNA_ORIENTATION=+